LILNFTLKVYLILSSCFLFSFTKFRYYTLFLKKERNINSSSIYTFLERDGMFFFLASLERGGGKSRKVNTDSSLRLRYGMFWAVTGIPLENPMIDLSRDLSAFPVKWLGSIYLELFGDKRRINSAMVLAALLKRETKKV